MFQIEEWCAFCAIYFGPRKFRLVNGMGIVGEGSCLFFLPSFFRWENLLKGLLHTREYRYLLESIENIDILSWESLDVLVLWAGSAVYVVRGVPPFFVLSKFSEESRWVRNLFPCSLIFIFIFIFSYMYGGSQILPV